MLSRNILGLLLGVVAFAEICAAAYAAESGSGTLPHIVFILADDLGYGDLRCTNDDSKVPTPNMDRLAAEGVRFLDAHSASSVCTPTRYGILTGRYC
jgi:arylsulfatase A